ncbi:eukaryotic translation initiation factor 2C, 2 [Chytriomyces hyalinus]|nr:eukaryotic translation initiation factor 2C, 2 [Chytriomyces hyalinus]
MLSASLDTAQQMSKEANAETRAGSIAGGLNPLAREWTPNGANPNEQHLDSDSETAPILPVRRHSHSCAPSYSHSYSHPHAGLPPFPSFSLNATGRVSSTAIGTPVNGLTRSNSLADSLGLLSIFSTYSGRSPASTTPPSPTPMFSVPAQQHMSVLLPAAGSRTINSASQIHKSLPLAAVLNPFRPRSPGTGSQGTPIHILTNFYDIHIPPALRVFHYEVRIIPESSSSTLNRRVMDAFKNAFMSVMMAGCGDSNSNIEVSPWLAVYDGQRSLFSPTRLPFVNDEVTTHVALVDEDISRRRVQKFGIRIRKLTDIQMDKLHLYNTGQITDIPRDTIQVLEVLLRQRPASLFTTIGRGGAGSFYSELQNTPIANALTVHQGWYQSVKPSFGCVKLNLDVSATSFYCSGPLIETVAKFFNRPTIEHARANFSDNHERKRLERFLRDMTIEIAYRSTGRKRYKIRALFDKPCAQTLIVTGTSPTDPRGKQIVAIIDYFQRMYGVTLQYPWLPCIVCGAKNDVILPMEVCFVRRNQRHVGKLNDQQLADIVKLTAVLPECRKERVADGMRQLHGNSALENAKSNFGDTVLQDWGVQIQPEMSIIEGRILAAPPLIFGPSNNPATDWKQVITPMDGTWRIGRNLRFATPSSLSVWAVAVFGDPHNFPIQTVGLFVKNIMTACVGLGMEVAERSIPDLIVYAPMPMQGMRMQSETIEATLRLANEKAVRMSGFSKAPHAMYGDENSFDNWSGGAFGGMVGSSAPTVAQMVICILAQKNTVYEQVKKIAETDIGIMTQCVIGKHVHTTKPSYAQNLALKINAKLGGVNSYVDPINELGGLGASQVPTMIMGADVTHPQYSSSDPSSIAALVGTVDARFCEYRSTVRIQNSKREIMQDLESMTRDLFELFHQRNGCYPVKILFYRDGVNENQVPEVLSEEIPAVKRACIALGIPEARLTFAVVNKRHHARFFPVRMEAGESDSKGNILAGTVIDSGITHPFEFDFYLTSHPGMQGTSKAAHYHVLYDENSFTADTLQEITYRLCYNFARSTRAVSVVPPAYYAHLVAARARCYASAQNNSTQNAGMWNGTRGLAGASPSLESLPMSWGGISSTGPPMTNMPSGHFGSSRSASNGSLVNSAGAGSVSGGLLYGGLSADFIGAGQSRGGFNSSASGGSPASSFVSSTLENHFGGNRNNHGRFRELPQVMAQLQGTMFFT